MLFQRRLKNRFNNHLTYIYTIHDTPSCNSYILFVYSSFFPSFFYFKTNKQLQNETQPWMEQIEKYFDRKMKRKQSLNISHKYQNHFDSNRNRYSKGFLSCQKTKISHKNAKIIFTFFFELLCGPLLCIFFFDQIHQKIWKMVKKIQNFTEFALRHSFVYARLESIRPIEDQLVIWLWSLQKFTW